MYRTSAGAAYAFADFGRTAGSAAGGFVHQFLRLLRTVWRELERQYFSFDVGLAFMESLTQDEIKGYLNRRVAQLEGMLVYLNSHQQEELAKQEAPRSTVAIFKHSRIHFQAELTWTQELLDQVERGELR